MKYYHIKYDVESELVSKIYISSVESTVNLLSTV